METTLTCLLQNMTATAYKIVKCGTEFDELTVHQPT